MNLLERFLGAFKTKSVSEKDSRWLAGNNAFERAKRHFVANEFQLSLDCCDEAIENAFDKGQVYDIRAQCLQAMEFHLDALDDFRIAISANPEDCNIIFLRSFSRSAVGDWDGCIADRKEAIRLSQADTALNRSYDAGAKEMGHRGGVAAFYESHLFHAELELESVRSRRQANLAPIMQPKLKRRQRN
jgi:tetratricopeptide (TPR) repeat protein